IPGWKDSKFGALFMECYGERVMDLSLNATDKKYLKENPSFALTNYFSVLAQQGVKLVDILASDDVKKVCKPNNVDYMNQLASCLVDVKVKDDDIVLLIGASPDHFSALIGKKMIEKGYNLSPKQLANIIGAVCNERIAQNPSLKKAILTQLIRCSSEFPLLIVNSLLSALKAAEDESFDHIHFRTNLAK